MRCHRLLDGKGQSTNSFALDGGRIFREMKVSVQLALLVAAEQNLPTRSSGRSPGIDGNLQIVSYG